MALVLLNLAGGESVGDVEVLEKDEGFCRILRQAEGYGKGRRERRGEGRRWRRGRRRGVPSASAVFRYLEGFHEAGEEERREAHRAFIPVANGALRGLWKVNGEMVGFVQRHEGQREATLDMDATLVESEKQEALASYKKTKAYQPLTTYWAEAEMIVHSEFRDGNVPAGYEQLRVMQEAMGHLPGGVEAVRLRSDTAGYQQELLKYCAEGRDERFGVIEFAVGVDVTAAFKRAVSAVREEEWQVLYRGTGGRAGGHRPGMGGGVLRAQLDRPPQEESGVSLPGHPGAAARSAFARARGAVGPALPHRGVLQPRLVQAHRGGDQPGAFRGGRDRVVPASGAARASRLTGC